MNYLKMANEEKLIVYLVKWYDTKEKGYTEELVRSLQRATELMAKAFQNGSTYCTIQTKEII